MHRRVGWLALVGICARRPSPKNSGQVAEVARLEAEGSSLEAEVRMRESAAESERIDKPSVIFRVILDKLVFVV